MDISHLYNKTVSTYRFIESIDSGGSPKARLSLNISSLPCRVQEEQGLESVIGGRKFSKISYNLYCAFGTDLLMSDLIFYEDEYYEVVEFEEEDNDSTYILVLLEKSNFVIPCEKDTWDFLGSTAAAVNSMVTFNDGTGSQIYGGAGSFGRLYRSDGVNDFIRIVDSSPSDNVSKLIEFNGTLYAGTFNNGILNRWDGASSWVEAARVVGSILNTPARRLIVFDNKIYGSLGIQLYEWNGTGDWVKKTSVATVMFGLAALDGELYGAGASGFGALYIWTGTDWSAVTPSIGGPPTDKIVDLVTFDNTIYGLYTSGTDTTVYKWDKVDTWIEVASITSFQGTDMMEFQNELYAVGTTGILYRINESTGALDAVASHDTRNVQVTMTEFDDTIYSCNNSNGNLFEWVCS